MRPISCDDSWSRLRILSGLVLGLMTAWAQGADVISVNLTEFNNALQNIDAGETYGVATLGSLVGGWSNKNQVLNATNLPFDDGTASTVSMQARAPNSWGSAVAGYNNTPMKGMIDDYTATVNPANLGFSNLNANFPNGYFAIVYLTGFDANEGASITDGTTTYYYQPVDFRVDTWDGTLVQTTTTTDLGSGNAPVAQYAVFGSDQAPLTSDSITFTIDTLYGGGSGIGGAQLVASSVPEPVAFGVGGTLVPLALLFWRSRRRRA